MNITKVLIEFIITFIVIYLVYYFVVIKKSKKDKNMVPAEVNIIIIMHKIDINKIDIYQMVKVVSFATTIILSLIITLISTFFDSTIIELLFGTAISLVVAVIVYRIIGVYYKNKSIKEK